VNVPGWRTCGRDGLEWFELDLPRGPRVAFFTRRGGDSSPPYASLNLSTDVGDDPAHVAANRERVRAALGLDRLFTMRQVHGMHVLRVTPDNAGTSDLEADACHTDLRGVALGVRVADCLPVWLWTEDASWVAAAHCGWRGTASGLALATARALAAQTGQPLCRLSYALGPCICPACYPVGEDVRSACAAGLPGHGGLLSPAGAGKWNLDLRAANRWLLQNAGLVERGSLDLCTLERPDTFFSARRDRTTGRSLAVIAPAS
jgi:YfiH family protein